MPALRLKVAPPSRRQGNRAGKMLALRKDERIKAIYAPDHNLRVAHPLRHPTLALVRPLDYDARAR